MAIFNFLKQYERIARFKWGVFEGVKGPGRVWLVPFMHLGVKVDLLPQAVRIPKQRHVTSDDMGVNIDCLVRIQVIAEHAHRSVLNVLDYRRAVTGLTTEPLRAVIGDVDVDRLVSQPELIGDALKGNLDAETERWGIRILNVELREIEPTGHISGFRHEKAQHSADEDEEKRIRNQDGLQRARSNTQAQCSALRNIGVDAQMLKQNPFTSLAAVVWIEMADGPIRWAAVGDPEADDAESWETICFVPDPRVRAGLPPVLIELHFESEGACWQLCEELHNDESGFNRRLAERLTQNLETEILMSCPSGCMFVPIPNTAAGRFGNKRRRRSGPSPCGMSIKQSQKPCSRFRSRLTNKQPEAAPNLDADCRPSARQGQRQLEGSAYWYRCSTKPHSNVPPYTASWSLSSKVGGVLGSVLLDPPHRIRTAPSPG